MKKDITAFKQSLKDEGAEERDTQIVTNMLKDHCPISTIEKYSQLSQEQIIQIAKANNIPLL